MKIDTSTGFVAVGGATPNIGFGVSRNTVLTVFGGTGANNSGGVEVAGSTTATGTVVGAICFSNDDSADSEKRIAQIHAKSSADDKDEGCLHFATHNGSTLDERVIINQDGNGGIGPASPDSLTALHVAASTKSLTLERFSTSASQDPGIRLLRSRGSAAGAFTVVQDNDDLGSITFAGSDGDSMANAASIEAEVDGTPGDGDMPGRLIFMTTPDGSATVTERMRIDSAGNILIGGTATPTSSAGNLCLFNGTAPAASVTNGVVLYAQDVSTSELKVRDEAGNVSTLSPHNFELLGERSEEMAWSYSSKNVFVGKEIAVDMTKVIRALEKLTGEEYIKIRDIADSEKLDWDEEEERKEAECKVNMDAYKAKKTESDKERADFDKKWGTLPTGSNTKAEIKAFLDDKKIKYEDATKEELLKKVPKKPEFTEVEPAAYTKKSKPKWVK